MSRTLPNDLFVANYNGVLTLEPVRGGAVLAEEVRASGARAAPAPTSSTRRSCPWACTGIPAGRHYNAPYFDSNDPEDRNNRQYTAALSYFLSTRQLGPPRPEGRRRVLHVLAHGRQLAVVDRATCSSADPVMSGGAPVRRRERPAHPELRAGREPHRELAARCAGAQIDLNTLSLYLNDRWTAQRARELQPRRALRAAHRRRHAGGHRQPSSSAIVPRLGVTLRRQGRRPVDPAGDLRPLRGQGRGDAVRRQHERGHAEPRRPTRTTAPPARASTSRPASTSPTTPSFNGSFPVAQRVPRRGPEDADHQGVDAAGGHPARPARRGQGRSTPTAARATSWTTSSPSTPARPR